MCRLLIGSGANVNAADKYGRTALIIAACNGYMEACELLLEKGAEIEVEDVNGRTALMLAVDEGHLAVRDLLVASGASKKGVGADSKEVSL